jgi:hypothetical protein
MLPLPQHLYEPLLLEACQMHAGRGRAHFPDDRQLCAGPCVTIEEAIKHPRPCRLANSGRDAGRTDLSWRLCNHSWMVDELTVSNNSAPSGCSGDNVGSNCVQSSYAAPVGYGAAAPRSIAQTATKAGWAAAPRPCGGAGTFLAWPLLCVSLIRIGRASLSDGARREAHNNSISRRMRRGRGHHHDLRI